MVKNLHHSDRKSLEFVRKYRKIFTIALKSTKIRRMVKIFGKTFTIYQFENTRRDKGVTDPGFAKTFLWMPGMAFCVL